MKELFINWKLDRRMNICNVSQRRQPCLESGGSWNRVKKISKFSGNFTKKKIDFSAQIYEKFRFCSGNFTKNFDFQGKFPKNFYFSGNFTQIIDFSGQIFEKFRFFQVIL